MTRQGLDAEHSVPLLLEVYKARSLKVVTSRGSKFRHTSGGIQFVHRSFLIIELRADSK